MAAKPCILSQLLRFCSANAGRPWKRRDMYSHVFVMFVDRMDKACRNLLHRLKCKACSHHIRPGWTLRGTAGHVMDMEECHGCNSKVLVMHV